MKGILREEVFGTLADGRRANLYTISNGRGMEAKVTNYGGIVTSIKVPDRDGKPGKLYSVLTVWKSISVRTLATARRLGVLRTGSGAPGLC